jgi:hypothetical protein
MVSWRYSANNQEVGMADGQSGSTEKSSEVVHHTVPHKAKKDKKDWHKRWWGVLFIICILPFFLIWFTWAKTKLGKPLKLAVTAVVVVICFGILSSSSQNNPSKNVSDNTRSNTTSSNASDNSAANTFSADSNSSAVSPQTGANTDQQITATTQPALTPTTSPSNSTPTNSAPAETVSQQEAVSKAEEYLNVEAFSHDGLIDQLEYDQFSTADATYAADNSNADWNQQAAKKAKEYLDSQAFSRQELIDQLEYDKFTPDQATYGVNSVGL